jgi:hypothetical protein
MRFPLIIAVVLAAAAGVAAHAAVHRPAASPGRVVLVAAVKKGVSLKSVPVTGLYPHATKQLTVSVKNAAGKTIKVPSLKGKIAAVTSRPGCTGTSSNLIVSYTGKPVTIPNRKTRAMGLTVTMPPSVADACQGATFKITISLRATKG